MGQSSWQLATGNWPKSKSGILTAKDAKGAKKSGKRKNNLGPSFAVKALLIQDDGLKRGEFAPRSLFRPANGREERILKLGG
jgi:hypothetical protein